MREALAERQIALRNAPAPRARPAVPHPGPQRDGLIDRRLARLLGGVLWMYDLSGGLRIRKAHRRLSTRRRARAHAHVATRRARVRVPLLRRASRRRAPHARDRAHRGRARRGGGEPRAAVGMLKEPSGRVAGVQIESDGRIVDVRARVVVNAGGVWADEVRALDEGAHPASLRPAKGVHITVPWEKVRNEIAMVVPVPRRPPVRVRGPVGQPHLHRHHRHRLRRTARRPAAARPTTSRTCSRAVNGAIVEPITGADVIATWAGLRPLLRTGEDERTADLSRRHGIRVSGAASSRSPAASSRRTGRWPRTPSTRSTSCSTAGTGTAARSGCSWWVQPATRSRPRAGPRSWRTSRGGTAPRRVWCRACSPGTPRWPSRSCRGCRT